jgi:hypothetical protein
MTHLWISFGVSLGVLIASAVYLPFCISDRIRWKKKVEELKRQLKIVGRDRD